MLSSVGRLVASLRLGTWNDPDADVASFAVDDLTAVVERFGGQPIYGWEFFDPAESDLESWSDRLSLDWGDRRSGMTNRLFLFQEGVNEHLDLCLWFDDLEIFDAAGQPLPVTVFCDGGQRWWTAMRQGDPRVAGEGIVPLGSKETE